MTALADGIDIIRRIWDADERKLLRVNGAHHRGDGAKRGPVPAHDIYARIQVGPGVGPPY